MSNTDSAEIIIARHQLWEAYRTCLRDGTGNGNLEATLSAMDGLWEAINNDYEGEDDSDEDNS